MARTNRKNTQPSKPAHSRRDRSINLRGSRIDKDEPRPFAQATWDMDDIRQDVSQEQGTVVDETAEEWTTQSSDYEFRPAERRRPSGPMPQRNSAKPRPARRVPDPGPALDKKPPLRVSPIRTKPVQKAVIKLPPHLRCPDESAPTNTRRVRRR